MLQKALSEIVKVTYNCLSVDGDTSTNDMVSLMANGLAGNEEITCEGEEFDTFKNALYEVMANLTRMLAKDGEAQASFLNVFATVLLTRIRQLLLQKVLFALLFSKPQCSARTLTGDVCFVQSDMRRRI